VKIKKIPVIVLVFFSLTACLASTSQKSPLWLQHAKTGQDHLNDNEYDLASEYFNKALKLNLKNPDLQALNGLTYHLTAANSNASNLTLAEEGYKLSSKFNPANWIPHYLIGTLHLDEKQFSKSKFEFLKAAVRNWPNNEILINLLVSSFYDLDFELTSQLIMYLRKNNENLTIKNKKILYKTCSIFYAITGEFENKKQCLISYKNLKIPKEHYKYLVKKLSVMPALRKISGFKLYKVQNTNTEAETEDTTTEAETEDTTTEAETEDTTTEAETEDTTTEAETEDTTTEAETEDTTGPQVIADEQMVVVDVVIIGTRENSRKTKGINILKGLKIQFGDTANSISAYSRTKNRTRDFNDSTNDANLEVFAKALTIPAIEYSFNVFNDNESQSRILARPSLIALSNQPSEFFSGTTVTAATTSGTGDSITIEKEVGVKLTVTPQFLSAKRVQLKVAAERTFLTDPDTTVQFEYRFDVTKTTINASVVLDIGDTLMLGGLTEQETETRKDGVPYLKELPIIKYAFSESGEQKYTKTLTILLTPRSPNSDNLSNRKNDQKINSNINNNLNQTEKLLVLKLLGGSGIKENSDDKKTRQFKNFISDQLFEPSELINNQKTDILIDLGNQIMKKYTLL
jgi:type II secretory pathway component GspD/PulD (secretin)